MQGFEHGNTRIPRHQSTGSYNGNVSTLIFYLLCPSNSLMIANRRLQVSERDVMVEQTMAAMSASIPSSTFAY